MARRTHAAAHRLCDASETKVRLSHCRAFCGSWVVVCGPTIDRLMYMESVSAREHQTPTRTDQRGFVDVCHRRGVAVSQDD